MFGEPNTHALQKIGVAGGTPSASGKIEPL
jgi:hypothetical protein